MSQGISRSFVPSQVTASKSQWAACAPHLTSSFAVDLRNDGQKLTAYVQVSALSKCLVNLSGVGSHVYHPIILFPVAFSQLLVRAKNQMKKRNKLVTLALHPGQDK